MVPERTRRKPAIAGALPAGRRVAQRFALAASLAISMCAYADRGPLTTAEWLMDIARDQALSLRDTSASGNPHEIQALLLGAIRLDSRLTDAHALLYEYAMFSGDALATAVHLDALIDCDPRHMGAYGRWLDQNLATRQTVEKRIEWLESVLTAEDRSPQRRALVLERLAVLALQRMDRRQSHDYALRALAADPMLPEAALLVFHTLPEDASLPDRLRTALAAVGLNCMNADLCWQTGLLLIQSGLPSQAETLLERAVRLHRGDNDGRQTPVICLIDLALAQWAAERYDAAILSIREAADRHDDPLSVEAGMLACWMLREQKRIGESEVFRQRLMNRFAEIRDPATAPIGELAQAAWFHCTLDTLPQRALLLAQTAAERAPRDEFIQRTLGWALWLNSRPADALAVLDPLAKSDPYATYLTARIHDEAEEREAAMRALEAMESPPGTGPAALLVQELRSKLGMPTTQPASALQSQLLNIWTSFDATPLRFESVVADALDVSIDLDERNLYPGQPWRATFTLHNRSAVPITLGDDGMVNPTFLLSFRIDGDRPRAWQHLMTVSLDRRRALAPGEKLRLRRTLNVGPLRRHSRMSPQQLLRIQMDVIFDPQKNETGEWMPSPTGRNLRTLYFNRLPANVSREGLNALFASLAGASDPARWEAIEVIADLLSEHQRAGLGQLKYTPEPVPAERLLHAVQAALTSDAWETRARMLEALQIAGLDVQTLRLVNGCLKHENWVVRLHAARLLSRNGLAARETLLNAAGDEPDELVRAVIRGRIEQIDKSANRPAAGGAAEGATPEKNSPDPSHAPTR